MMRGITACNRVFTAFVRVTLVVAFLAGALAERGSAQDKGKWYRVSTGIDHNGEAFKEQPPMYFAEVKLRIELGTKDNRDSVDTYASQGDTAKLKAFLRKMLPGADNDEDKKAKRALIEALTPRTQPPDTQMRMGIDWVNFGTGNDYSGPGFAPASYFAEIHLQIPLTAERKRELDKLLSQEDADVRKELETALEAAGTAHEDTKALVKALKLKKEKS